MVDFASPSKRPPDRRHDVTTLLLVDDHQLLRQGLRRAVEEAGFTVIGEAGDGAEAVRLAETYRPDLVLMDVSMPVLDGIEATRRITELVPDTRVVMLSMHGEEDTISRAIKAGAVGYLGKDCTMAEVAETLAKVAAGDTAISSGLARTMLAAPPVDAETATPVLSKREEEVLQLFAEGRTTSEVARELFISAKTVKNHLASIYEKLDAHDRTHAVLTAVKMGIIQLR
jgi:DNA-binding NarL/FixJ family response regulator